MKYKFSFIFVLVYFILFVLNIPALAHKVNIFAYIEGEKVYTESYFNDGKKCINSKIEVFDINEVKLLEGLTDEKGIFIFDLPQTSYLKIILTASLGHRAENILEINHGKELEKLEIDNSEVNSTEIVQKNNPNVSKEDIQKLINQALDEKLAPIMREIKKSQEEKISFNDIIGGIGYILGIFGIMAYFLSRKK
jgi:nickel transport protein